MRALRAPCGHPSQRRGTRTSPRRYLAAHLRAPRAPNYDEADKSDKPAFVKAGRRLSANTVKRVDRWYAFRLASLLAIDEGVRRIYVQLRKSRELRNTYIVYASD